MSGKCNIFNSVLFVICTDVEKFKTHRLQLEESIQKGEIERTKVTFYSRSLTMIHQLASYSLNLWLLL